MDATEMGTTDMGAMDMGLAGSRPVCLSIAPCSCPSTPLRAAFSGGLRPVLTGTARDAISALQAGTEKRRSSRTEKRFSHAFPRSGGAMELAVAGITLRLYA